MPHISLVYTLSGLQFSPSFLCFHLAISNVTYNFLLSYIMCSDWSKSQQIDFNSHWINLTVSFKSILTSSWVKNTWLLSNQLKNWAVRMTKKQNLKTNTLSLLEAGCIAALKDNLQHDWAEFNCTDNKDAAYCIWGQDRGWEGGTDGQMEGRTDGRAGGRAGGGRESNLSHYILEPVCTS